MEGQNQTSGTLAGLFTSCCVNDFGAPLTLSAFEKGRRFHDLMVFGRTHSAHEGGCVAFMLQMNYLADHVLVHDSRAPL